MQYEEQKKDNTDRNYVNILGINVLSTSISHLLTSVRENLSHNKKFFILTPNPELVLASTKNIDLKTALNSATFSIPDGVGLNFASKFLFGEPLKIIPGRKLFLDLIALANKKGWKVFFLGGNGKEAESAAEKLKISYKNIKIETFAGPRLNDSASPASEADKALQKEAVSLINKFSPHVLFVAFGNPKQEIWIYKNLKSLNIGGAMAVGGTFRYIAGMSPLPPRWMERGGLEWVYRLVTEPHRLGRVFNAFPIFPLRIFWFKIVGR
jgi:N-acetylglucosaminyldiphosphoundecaprenol N-acetyl-beta-D-mannosaminyltransferase